MIDPAKREAFKGVLQSMIDDGASEDVINEATAKFKAKYDQAESPPLQAGHGMGDLKMAEDAPHDYSTLPTGPNMTLPAGDRKYAAQLAAKPFQFAGDVAQALSTGPINAVTQAVQDKIDSPASIPWQAAKNLVKSTLTPFHTFESPIQSSETSLKRAGVPNQPSESINQVPGFVMQAQHPENPGAYESGKMYPVTMKSSGLAKQIGFAADNLTPMVGLEAIKASGAASRAALDALANGAKSAREAATEPIGRVLQSAGTDQMNRVVSPLMRHERNARTPISDVIFKYNFDKPTAPTLDAAGNAISAGNGADVQTMFSRSGQKLKDLSQELKASIKAGNDGGAKIDAHSIIDAAVQDLKDSRGESPDFYKYVNDIDGVAEDLKKTVGLANGNGGGTLDLLQSQGLKQYTGAQGKWLQYAKSKGIPTTAKEDAASILAETVNRKLNSAIDGFTDGETGAINKQISEIIPAHEALGWRQIVDNRKQSFSLNDVIGLTATAIDPKLAALYAVKKASQSGKVASWMYRLGEKMRASETPEQAARYLAAMKKKGMTEDQIATAMQDFTPQAIDIPDASYITEGVGSGVKNEPSFGAVTQPKQPQFDPMADLYPPNHTSMAEPEITRPRAAPQEYAPQVPNKPKHLHGTSKQQLLQNGSPHYQTEVVAAKDAPDTFVLNGRTFTKAETANAKTKSYLDDKGEAYSVPIDGTIHMDPRVKAEPAPPTPPIEALAPRNPPPPPESGLPGIEGMAPPEMAHARAADRQAAIDAYIRQGRPVRAGLQKSEPTNFQVIDRPAKTAQPEAKPLDHGELNIPLSKRGDIDTQIDQYKNEQSAMKALESKSRSKQWNEDKAAAKGLLEKNMGDLIEKGAKKTGNKAADVKKAYERILQNNPSGLRKVLEKEYGP